MTGKRSKRLNSTLVSVGMVALVAGCGGGGAVSNSNGSTTYIPPAGKQMTTATLSLLVPGRRPSSGNRTPRYVSPYTTRIDVSAVSAGAPSPWPVATSTSVPTPGPLASGATPTPIPITMQVPAPLGSTQFAVNTYDGGGYLLSGITTPPQSVVSNSPNALNLVLNAAAACVQINHTAGGAFTMTPLIDQTSPQTATFTVTPCDADGYAIPAGAALANAITFATPAPVSITVNSNRRRPKAAPSPANLFSPSVITTGGDTTVTVTYPSQSSSVFTAQAAPSPMPSGAAGGLPGITIDPVFLALVPNHDDGSANVFVKDMQGTLPFQSLGSPLSTGLYPSAIAAGGPMDGCANAGQAMIANQGSLTVLTEPNPTQANPTPMPVVSAITAGFTNGGSAVALDTSCIAYAGDSSGYMYTVPMSGPATTSGSSYYTTSTGNPMLSAPITSAAWMGGLTYIGLGSTSGYLNNIVDLNNNDMQVGEGTALMARYDAGSLAIAYQPPGNGDYYLARVAPNGSGYMLTDASQDLGSNSYFSPVTALTVDRNGIIWAAGGAWLYAFNPVSNTLTSYGLAPGNTHPTAMAAGPDGTLFVTDNGTAPGTVTLYSWQNITGGVGLTAAPLGSYPAGTNPSGIAIAP